MSNIEKLAALEPAKPKSGVSPEELQAIKDARERGCTWRQIWEAGDWPYKTFSSFVGSVGSKVNYPK